MSVGLLLNLRRQNRYFTAHDTFAHFGPSTLDFGSKHLRMLLSVACKVGKYIFVQDGHTKIHITTLRVMRRALSYDINGPLVATCERSETSRKIGRQRWFASCSTECRSWVVRSPIPSAKRSVQGGSVGPRRLVQQSHANSKYFNPVLPADFFHTSHCPNPFAGC